ncbi:CBS domain-containing protein [Streptacidiphilus sp. EB129]|uniref:CBS domain-containing protein n=1 Tax=Streptacidiphilus sp. EB129 TaxID=3156262 RepID=UPI0035180C9B
MTSLRTPTHDPSAAEVMTPADLQVSDHTAVDKAMAILHSAHVEHLLIRGDDGRCVGLVTGAQLDRYRSQPWYGQHSRLRDVDHDSGPFARPDMSAHSAAAAMRARALNAWPVVDDDGFALGIITEERLRLFTAQPSARPATDC